MFYTGKVCAQHPEAEGLRYTSCRKCVPCHNVVAAQNRRNTVKRATPPWADKQKINKIYERAARQGKVVDHIIPLNHPKVCGLHVPNNLRAALPLKNLTKGNKFRVITLKGSTNGTK